MKFIDHTQIQVRGGRGGNGLVSFASMKGKPKMGPDGGNGGHGGSVILVGNRGANTLSQLRYKQWYEAEPGAKGGNNDKTGRCGSDKEVIVPVGTQIYNAETNEFLGEIINHGERLLIARGGRRGFGNKHFVSATHQAPQEAVDGKPGDEIPLRLELKLLADVGLAGFPNAGKSTLLSKVSGARPKIADYPFTTLVPQLGVVEAEEEFSLESFVLADIPGLIEGASEGRGLGHDFLKHLERTKIIVYMLAAYAEQEPAEAFAILQRELKNFDEDLATRPFVVVLNKCDLLSEDEIEAERRTFKELGHDIITISGWTGAGVSELKRHLFELVRETKTTETVPDEFFSMPPHLLSTHGNESPSYS